MSKEDSKDKGIDYKNPWEAIWGENTEKNPYRFGIKFEDGEPKPIYE